MISFTIITSTPAVVRNFLINRGIAQIVTNPRDGSQSLQGTLPGFEFTVNAVPNPIITNPGSGTPSTPSNPNPSYVPPTYDTRNVYLVKMVRDIEGDQTSGITQFNSFGGFDAQGFPIYVQPTPAQLLNNTKFGQWIMANGARNDLNVNGTIVPAYQITGQQIWVAVDMAGLFGTWQ